MAIWRNLEYTNIPKDCFAVSDEGDIVSIHPKASCYVSTIDTGKHLAYMHYNNATFPVPLARLVAVMFVPTPEGIHYSHFWVEHIDGDKSNMRAENLKWVIPGKIDYYERKKLLDFVHAHRDLKPLELVTLYEQETGIKVGKQVIQNIYAGRGGNTEIFGYTSKDLYPLYQANRISDQTIHQICRIIVECNGNTRKIHRTMREKNIAVKPETVNRILWKVAYTSISDEYFMYYGRGQFIPIKK